MTAKKETYFVTGHRNPDIDSLAGSVALAELRRRQSGCKVIPLCPGVLPDRAKYLFKRFGITPPVCRNDVYLQIRDVMNSVPETIPGSESLFEGVNKLRQSGLARLPVTGKDGKFLGMLSSLTLLSSLLDLSGDSGNGFTTRRIQSSIALLKTVIDAEILTAYDEKRNQDFEVYVAAMGLDSFDSHLPSGNEGELAVIVGDRPEIHMRALQRGIRLLIVTGERPVEPLILKAAAEQNVSILKTQLDSASVIRRLKFSMPVESFNLVHQELHLSPGGRVRDWRKKLLNQPEDVFPVLDESGSLCGILTKKELIDPAPFKLILVDHNELEQSLPGVEDLPVIEIVDHHRIGMISTVNPIKYTADVVGSSCTLIAQMFRSSGESLSPELAGLLLGGIVSDTLDLHSPTTAPADHRMYEWLEKLSGVSGTALMNELQSIDSPLASKNAAEVLNGDRKNYRDHAFSFALSQVEESNLVLLHQRETELLDELGAICRKDNLDFFGLLVTDAVRQNSELLICGSEDVLLSLPYERTGNRFFLPGVLSRKKQLLPQILASLSSLVGDAN